MFRYNDTMFDTRLDANTAAVEDWLTASGRNTAAETRAYLRDARRRRRHGRPHRLGLDAPLPGRRRSARGPRGRA